MGLLSLLILWSSAPLFATGAPPLATIRSIQALAALTNAQAAQALPVQFEATVTFAEAQDDSLFVEDKGQGTYVNFDKELGLVPGDRVTVIGVTAASFKPEVTASEVRLISHGKLPAPLEARYDDLIRSKLDSRYVTITGHVLSATLDQEKPEPGMRIQMQMPDGNLTARVGHPGSLRGANLLDADIRLNGVAGGAFDGRMQMSGVWLDVNSASDVSVVKPSLINPWDLPTVPMDQVIFGYRSSNSSQRVRIAGTLTYYEPGTLAVVEQNNQAMLVETGTTSPLKAGFGIEATGFPAVQGDSVRLADGQLRNLTVSTPVQPQAIDWESASAGKFAYSLVSMEGKVVALVQDSRVDKLIIESEHHLFSATLRHSSFTNNVGSSSSSQSTTNLSTGTASNQAFSDRVSVGSQVKVVGVCFVDAGDHWHDRMWFDLRLRSLDDVAVIQSPSWWTVRRLAYATTFLSAAILIAVIWVGLLDRRLRAQSAIFAKQSQEEAIRERRLARQEQHRSHILELISSSEPLSEVLREIGQMVSSRLLGASCWFELNASGGGVADPIRPSGPEIVFHDLFAPDGTALGMMLATPQRRASTDQDITAALTAGARLAELAIDTRRLYSDLRHRSEHDLLTELPNRFSMEKRLNELMLKATRTGEIFGLVYVDLDRFKQVNDRYGHRTGDLYLQEVTRRMKVQLRNQDVLARIGGDEFIALVPILRSRADAEEIVRRIDRCFDEHFEIEGYILHGSASVGLAVYPEDGATQEDLQRSADTAMYKHKEAKRSEDLDAELREISK